MGMSLKVLQEIKHKNFENLLAVFYLLNQRSCKSQCSNCIKPNQCRLYFKIYYFAHVLHSACYKNVRD